MKIKNRNPIIELSYMEARAIQHVIGKMSICSIESLRISSEQYDVALRVFDEMFDAFGTAGPIIEISPRC